MKLVTILSLLLPVFPAEKINLTLDSAVRMLGRLPHLFPDYFGTQMFFCCSHVFVVVVVLVFCLFFLNMA